MKFLKHYAIVVLIISLLLTGCLGVAGEPFHPTLKRMQEEHQLEHLAQELLIGHGDLKTCMFTMWYFTKPDAPPIEQAKNVCKNIITSMDEWEYNTVIEEIEKELEKVKEAEPVICTGNCV